ncbi:MAG: hypothetical protein WEC39_00020 [Patescibacteria group bacterium]
MEEEKKQTYVCTECGHEGPEVDICPECGGTMVPEEEMGTDELEGEEELKADEDEEL